MRRKHSPGCPCCGPAGPPGPCVIDLCINVNILDAGDPMDDVSVTVVRDSDDRVVAEGETDGDGSFCVRLEGEDAEAGFHTIHISKFCYVPFPGNTNPIQLFCGEENHNFLMSLHPDCLVRCDECPDGTAYPRNATFTLGAQWGIYNGVSGTTSNFFSGTFPNLGNDFTPGTNWFLLGGGRPTIFEIDVCAQTVIIRWVDVSGFETPLSGTRLCMNGTPLDGFGTCGDADILCPTGSGSAYYSNASGNRNGTLSWSAPPLPMMAPMPMMATGEVTASPRRPSSREILANAEACPHRVPMPEDRRTGCGCQHLCEAGRGPKWRKGGVTVLDCWACPIAPRRMNQFG